MADFVLNGQGDDSEYHEQALALYHPPINPEDRRNWTSTQIGRDEHGYYLTFALREWGQSAAEVLTSLRMRPSADCTRMVDDKVDQRDLTLNTGGWMLKRFTLTRGGRELYHVATGTLDWVKDGVDLQTRWYWRGLYSASGSE
ncbi:MAG: hypothetical protein AAF515_11535 [Pseudomonadota bacterium]